MQQGQSLVKSSNRKKCKKLKAGRSELTFPFQWQLECLLVWTLKAKAMKKLLGCVLMIKE